ncbi:TRAP transporter large permease [Vandammella animalimorsus]|uniref:TRAP transporter large permease protein n=1 Tax=Vandammella animalimorsus TaxID=2029117 RepID=A0A2A2A7E3_9BURK|nr:TRAP transporter large permease [Vandammella animalimorsus]PAT33687.1 C4-dicarboxylate ABC transporter permease [Vandammella animalimorsus]
MTLLVFLVLLLLQVPIGVVLCLTAMFYAWHSGNAVLFESFGQQLFGSAESYGLLAVPLFILAGELMNEGGLTLRLIRCAHVFVGGFRGGLAYINLLANTLMAAVMGSAVAQIAVMSRAMVPQMEREGYDKSFATAITAASGLMGAIVPPSMMFVVYGVLAQLSIGDMFMAGLLPGLIMGLSFCIIVAGAGLILPYPKGQWLPLAQAMRAILGALPALTVPAIIVGSILTGLATPTESAGLASVTALLVGRFIHQELAFSQLMAVLKRTAHSAGLVLFLVAAAGVFGWTITFEQIPQLVAQWISASTDSPFVFLLMVMALLLAIGMVLDGIAALILIVPILLPIATQQFGIHPLHFGVVICINLVLGLLTPPVGTGLFVAAAMTGEPPQRLFRALLPFLLAVCLLLVWLCYDAWAIKALLPA